MRVSFFLAAGCAAIFLSILAAPALADNARLPYHEVYDAQKAGENFNRTHTNLFVVLTVQSTVPGVNTSNILLSIEARAGKIPIEIGAAGEFAIPLRDDLRAEDPWITANQPKGTMKLNCKVGILMGRLTHSVSYARLMQPVRDSQHIQEQMRRFLPGSARLTATGLKLTFPAAAKKPAAIIRARGGDRKLEADEHGQIILPLVSDLLEENPQISLTDLPVTVEIVWHKRETE